MDRPGLETLSLGAIIGLAVTETKAWVILREDCQGGRDDREPTNRGRGIKEVLRNLAA